MVRTASMFSQLLNIFPRIEFEKAVRAHKAERYAKGFTCWEQFVAMLFCQLAQAHSLREICGGLSCCLGKLIHLGVRDAPKRSTLSYANKHRPWELYENVFYQLLEKCQLQTPGKTKFRFRNKLLSLDATVIDLCVTLFRLGGFPPDQRSRQATLAIGITTVTCPPLLRSLKATCTRSKSPRNCTFRREASWWSTAASPISASFDAGLTKAYTSSHGKKFNAAYQIVERRNVPENRGVLSDEVIRFTGPKTKHDCPHLLRRIVYQDKETGKKLVFLTNHLDFGATTIASIYKDRWQIELFFKALKQNLKVKTFVGTSPNALKTQIWTALIAMLLLKYLQLRSRLNWALSNLVALLHWNLFTYRDLWRWLDNPFETPPLPPIPQQILLRF